MTPTIRWAAWYGDVDLAVPFPAGWDVRMCPPADGPALDADAIVAALRDPIATPALRTLAAGRGRPCIVIDDLTRPTPGHLLLPPLLAELAAGGIPARDVRVLIATANHRPLTRDDLVKKLGSETLEACVIDQHFSWDGCRSVGSTSRGTPVEINAALLDADLRILVGSIIPHAGTGFSGGAKLLLPGAASIASAAAFHAGPALRGAYGDEADEARLDAEEAAALVGIDFIVNVVPNSRREAAAVVCGDVVAAHRRGVAIAREVFATTAPSGCDVGLFSLYPKDTELLQLITALSPYKTAAEPVVREGGTVVVAAAATEGFGFHSLFGPGMQFGATAPTRVRGRDLLVFSPGVTRGALSDAIREGTQLVRTWDEAIGWLEAKHGPAATAAVFPCATIQLAR